jgi:hypothetical protein
MKLVKVISGVYGWLDPGSNRRIAKTNNDPPFEETDVKAARFVKTKVLTYAETSEKSAPAKQQTITPKSGDNSGAENKEAGDNSGKPYSEAMKFQDLAKIAKELGLEVKTLGMKKLDLIALMDERWAEIESEDNDEDEDEDPEDQTPPPSFGALDPKD